MRLVGTVIRSRNVGRQMAVVETWMEVRRLAFSSEEPEDICTLRYPDGVKIVSYADDIVIMSNEPERNTLIQQAFSTLDQRCRVLW